MIDSTQEIKRLLTGQFASHDGIILAFEEIKIRNIIGWQGYLNGADNVRTFGVAKEVREYIVSEEEPDPLHLFMGILIKYGQLAALASKPDAVGFLAAKALGSAILYVLEETDFGHMKVSFYTARSATSQLTLNNAVKRFEEELPDTVERTEVEPEDEKGKRRR